MDIRRMTCLIVRRNGLYLVGRNQFSGGLSWSRYRYDAWRTRDIDVAREVAKRLGGTLMLFNPAAGTVEIY